MQSVKTRVTRVGAGALVLALGQAGCGGGQTAKHPAQTAAQPATFAQTVELRPVSGKVLVAVPPPGGNAGGQKFVPLSAAREVAIGSVVDTTSGRVRLTVATAPPTKLRSGEFHGGIFAIGQPSSDGGLAVLTIRDNRSRRTSCSTTHGRKSKSKRILGLLRGTASEGFQTVGKFSAATVRGTEWGVRNRCDGTFTVVQEGEVVVHEFRPNRSIVLHTGQTFLASAG